MFESFMVLNRSSSPKPKSLQPPSSLLHFEPFIFPSEQLTRVKRWNQADLGYFDPHLNKKAYGPGEIISVGKDIYYRNVILFVQCIQNLVIFKRVALVRSNIPTSLHGSALEWYTLKLNDQERESLNKDAGIDNWIFTLS